MANYRDKLRDSLVTRIQLFLFDKILKGKLIKIEKLNDYIDEILQFEITNELANFYSNTYYQIEKEKKISFNGKK